MIDVGLIVLRGSKSSIEKKLPAIFGNIFPQIRKKLYVKLDVIQTYDFLELVPIIYRNASQIPQNVDLRVLLNRKRKISINHIFEEQSNNVFTPQNEKIWPEDLTTFPNKAFNSVVLGGTFDRLHNGHKVLLSIAILLTNQVLTCGVTNGEMNKKKILFELIEPIANRCRAVEEFILDVSENIECRTVPINDPYGPSIVDPDMRCIVVSEETLKGGDMVNVKRKELGFCELNVHVVKLLEDVNEVLNETKVSSSSKRLNLLGTILREPKLHNLKPDFVKSDSNHYVIGLTGGIASGKTHIAKYLSGLGCSVIDCDKIGHELYAESQELRLKLVATFGNGVLSSDDTINRRNLGTIVFGNKAEMEKLNKIVWPAIGEKVQQRIANSTQKIVVVDAAVMLEAGWDKFVDQVWTTFVPRDEAIQRVCTRDKISKEQAEKRIFSQISNEERIARSNIVFCTMWENRETEAQVQRALNIIKEKYIN